ncbi:MAG TPA: hypothetical protein VNO70_19655 [Blastocatellia bacterium]|nr:hypothetical protein [Blastocatellia bacterium]
MARTFAIALILLLITPFVQGQQRQLFAVRGEVVKVRPQSKGMLLITVRPAKEFSEVTVLARENDLVGSAASREGGGDLLGLLAGEADEDEAITAAELGEGDRVSVIYDPRLQNRVIEIYLHD